MKAIETFWKYTPEQLYDLLGTNASGLSDQQAGERVQSKTKQGRRPIVSDLLLFFRQFRNPLVLLLVFALLLSFGAGTYVDGGIIFCILFLSGLLGFIQERRASKAAEKLRSLIQTKARVKRNGRIEEIPMAQVAPGDIVLLEAGDIVPADALIIDSKDLYVNESALTGESFPSEKKEGPLAGSTPLIGRKNSVFRGTSVISGTAHVISAMPAEESELGKIQTNIEGMSEATAFEKGIKRFGYLLMRVALIMSALTLIVNVVMGRPALDSVLFALALSVGITPELLPAVVTITLSEGAKQLAKKKVVVKKLSSIQNLGSVDVLCSDKTGTLTDGEVKIDSCLNADGERDDRIRRYAYLNSFFESGYTNPMDAAIVRYFKQDISGFTKFDEVPYDFIRKRLSIVVAYEEKHIMITKGAFASVIAACSAVQLHGENTSPIEHYRERITSHFETCSAKGFRVIGICYKDVTGDPVISKEDEQDMIFLGFILLNDPPKEGILHVINDLRSKQVALKIITGDNMLIAGSIAAQLGIESERILSGAEIHRMSDEALAAKAISVSIFAETEPSQKERIVRALQANNYVVGYLGDGINDASALKVADVGISVNNAVDVAKESADVILLEKDLSVIADGIVEGRKTYINTTKYILNSVCTNFGNMLSLAILSMVFPYLPLLPAQVLLINFLTDLPALAIVSDNVDNEFLLRPRKWDIKLIRNFMVAFGLESSLFDFITFAVLIAVFHLPVSAIRTGWFVESVISGVLILLVIRTHRLFFASRPGKALLTASLFVILAVLFIPYLPLSSKIDLSYMAPSVTLCMCGLALLYALLGEATKRILFRRTGY